MPRSAGAVNRFAPRRPIELEPEHDVERLGPTTFRSAGTEPWLAIVTKRPSRRDGWMRMRYRAGLGQDPVRPLLRMRDAEGREHYEIMAGPVCGQATWIWRLPPETVSLALSPVAEVGPFSFAVDDLRPVGRPELFAVALRRKPPLAFRALALRLSGKRVRARHFIKSIWATMPMRDYPRWRRARWATPLPDAEEVGWTEPLTILVDTRGAAEGERERTQASLAQLVAKVHLFSGDPILVEAGWLAAVRAGDRIAPDALAILAAHLRREPSIETFYSDGETIDAKGRPLSPLLEPDPSPRFAMARGDWNGLVLTRTGGGVIRAQPGEDLSKVLLHRSSRGPVAHVRRILLQRLTTRRPEPRPREAEPPRASDAAPAASVVIPTRDRLDLLRGCVEGVRARTACDDLEILIVDNGSEDAETLAYYVSLAADRRVRVLSRPGPFNFSHLCNEGVAAARGAVVVLLNNDVEVIEPDWLDRMVHEAARPSIGAVGARLLYPDGRLQHGGVIVGLGGGAGHIDRGQPGDAPGWLGRQQVTHEISAVTGACLAVARDKYLQVGGLDDEHLAVSYNDIDFCLKLRAAGYTNLMVPSATLFHHESASRGADRDGDKQARAEQEAAIFAGRWRAVMRDDPYYHPGLSLLRFKTSLG